jgi:hypothetical protein
MMTEVFAQPPTISDEQLEEVIPALPEGFKQAEATA